MTNKITKIRRLLIPALLAAGFFACEIERFENSSAPVPEAELRISAQIIGESISENDNGLLSSFSEAFALPSESGLETGNSILPAGNFRNLQNFSHEFNPEDGTHTVRFTRTKETPVLSSAADFTLTYIFFDRNGQFIEFPDQNSGIIESVDFKGTRSGEIQTADKQSFFTRTDRLLLDGLSSQSSILTIDGFHTGEGVFTIIENNGIQSGREYLLDMNFLNVRIDKEIVLTNRNFRKGVSGALSYESTTRQVNTNNSASQIVNGTIEFNGDGTALVRFRELTDAFRLQLDNGDVFDEDEFEGRVTRVDLQQNIFTIASGQRIQVNEQTEIDDDGDFLTLTEVSNAIDTGARVIAEGDYFRPDENANLWITTEVEFKLESNEFEDLVSSVNIADQSFTLVNGDIFFITNQTDIEFADGLESLHDVADAVASGLPVEADGEFFFEIESNRRIVKDVEFEFDFTKFEEYVISVNMAESTFTIESGKTIKITDDTVILDGDFNSLQEVSDALNDGEMVEAEGKILFDQAAGIWIAYEVEFED
ncbi:MAG: DUF5666 domain-containing protein [Balneolaceae bacterium]